jgi:molecular chaperone DnaK (HSP70)
MITILFQCLLLYAFLVTSPAFIKRLPSKALSVTVHRGHSVGIDLGTTFSLVSVVKDGKPKLLTIHGSKLFPSVVYYGKDGKVLTGKEALQMQVVDPLNTFTSVKRLIGRTMGMAIAADDDKMFRKSLVGIPSANKSKSNELDCGLFCPNRDKILSPQQISCEILRSLIQTASEYFNGQEVTNAVITVPAHFTQAQRDATEEAGYLAGLKKVKLLREPESAALAHGLLETRAKLVLVVDLGGGTFDISILDISGAADDVREIANKSPNSSLRQLKQQTKTGEGESDVMKGRLIEVVVTCGDAHLGGDDFDALLVEYVYQAIQKYAHSISFTTNLPALIKRDRTKGAILLNRCQQAKLCLSNEKSAVISLDSLIPIIYEFPLKEVTITRQKFQALAAPLIPRIVRPIREAAILGGVNLPGDSGQTALPSSYFPDEDDVGIGMESFSNTPSKDKWKSGKEEPVTGRTRKENQLLKEHASKVSNGQPVDINSLTLFPAGKEVDQVLLVGGATRMPFMRSLLRTITGIEPTSSSISPDEAVCIGAGIMAGMCDGTIAGLHVMSPLQAAFIRRVAIEKEKGRDIIAMLQQLEQNSTTISTEAASVTDTIPAHRSSNQETARIVAKPPRVSILDRKLKKK